MKKLNIFSWAAALVLAVSCNTYDDSVLSSRVDSLDSRLSKIEQALQTINSDIAALQSAVKALQNCDFVTSVQTLADGSGYTINFSNSPSITISNGKDGANGTDGADGKDGQNGKDGTNGKDGADGAPGHTPVVGVQLIDGQYYWTVDGVLLKDNGGNNVPAGRDGASPQIRITDGYWEVTYDGGLTWTKVGVATETITTTSIFSDVKQTDDTVTLFLTEGGSIVLPKAKTFALVLNTADVATFAGETSEIPYSITGYVEGTTVGCMGNNGYAATMVPASDGTGVLKVVAPTSVVDGSVIAFADNNKGNSSIKMICFEEGSVSVVADAEEVPAAGGTVTVKVITNLDFDVVIPEDVDWITLEGTKALREETVGFIVAKNTSVEQRSATITFRDKSKRVVKTAAVVQAGNLPLSATLSARAHSFSVACKPGVSDVASDSDWITATYLDGIGKINIEVKANATGASRSGNVTYKIGDQAKTFPVVQNALPEGAPVADLFDAMFLSDTTVVDVSAAARTVTTWKGTKLDLVDSPYGWAPDFLAVNDGKAHAVSSTYGFPIDATLNSALADGFTMESVFTAEKLAHLESKFFSSTAGSGIALMTNKPNDHLLFLLNNGSWKIVDTGIVPELGRFYHIAGTWDGTTARVYVDGVQMTEMEVSGTLKMGTLAQNWICIGANESKVDASGNLTTINGHWTGIVPVARLYDKALSAEEVKASYDLDSEGIVLE